MTFFIILGLIGAAFGCLAIAVFIAVNHFGERHQARMGSTAIPKAYGGLQINPGALISRIGSGAPAHYSLDTVIMRPTIGIKAFGALMFVAIVSLFLGESGNVFRADLLSLLLAGGCVIYYVTFLLFYEVRYNAQNLTAPGWFFRPATHKWEDLISIKQTDMVTYVLLFETGKVRVRKFLVGMPTFLTFVTDVRALNKRN